MPGVRALQHPRLLHALIDEQPLTLSGAKVDFEIQAELFDGEGAGWGIARHEPRS
jgi:hypothetical protein